MFQVIASKGDSHLGGSDFDNNMAAYLFQNYANKRTSLYNESERNQRYTSLPRLDAFVEFSRVWGGTRKYFWGIGDTLTEHHTCSSSATELHVCETYIFSRVGLLAAQVQLVLITTGSFTIA